MLRLRVWLFIDRLALEDSEILAADDVFSENNGRSRVTS
jgi:hypothetical protein